MLKTALGCSAGKWQSWVRLQSLGLFIALMTLCDISLSACLFVWYLFFPWIESMRVASCLFFFIMDGSNILHRDRCTAGSLWIPRREEIFSLIFRWQEAFFLLMSTPLLALPMSIGQAERWHGDVEELTNSELGRGNGEWAEPRETGSLESWPEGQVQSSNEYLRQGPLYNPRTPEDEILQDPREQKGLLCWGKESVGGFKGDKETGRRSGPKQHESRVGGLSKGRVGPIDRASGPWGIFFEKKG